jgi:hypothetical protein
MMRIFLYLALVTAVSSCSTHKNYAYAPAYSDGGSRYRLSEKSGGLGKQNAAGNEKIQDQQRVVIYNGSLTLAVKNVDSVNANISRVAEKYEGYVLTLGSERSVIRVKSVFLSQAMRDIVPMGKLKNKSVYGEDVTEDYYDSKIRLENCTKARQRYLELLAKAENVEAALKVEKELERLNKEIDVLEGKLKRLAHLSEYSTITVTLRQKVKPGVLGYVFIGLYKGVKWLFVRG